VNEAKDLSIIIPTFNNVEFIDSCLDSVLKSGEGYNIEILVGIDACPETLLHIKNKKHSPLIKFYLFNENSGPYVVKNTLSLKSSSDNLLFFDSDDLMNKDMIGCILFHLKNHDCVRPRYIEFKGDPSNTSGPIIPGEGVFAIKKNIFINIKGFRGWRCAADSDLSERLKRSSAQTVSPPNFLFLRRLHPNSLTQHPDTALSSPLRMKYIGKMRENKSVKNFAITFCSFII
jgi:glycosyltransferase involved in cell wall biosynthesis